MLFSIRNTVSLAKFSYAFIILNVFIMFTFFVGIYCEPKQLPSHNQMIVIGLSAVFGLFSGLYIAYRTNFSSLYALLMLLYFFILWEILLSGSVAAFVLRLAGRDDLRWFAFNTNAVCMAFSLIVGMSMEAGRLGMLKGENDWREKIDEYIDYTRRQVSPTLTTKPHTMNVKDLIWLVAAGSANIPLLFELYGGGRINAVFIAAPMLMIVFAYVNLITFGPGLTRLLLLRKIEKEMGYRFQNADYEEIQEIRRRFFMAEWLMKDYQPPQTENVADTATKKQTGIKPKKQRRRK